MVESPQLPLHISQAFNLEVDEADLDFFDANLYYDTPLFIDPFLFKTSPLAKERELFDRFGLFFKAAFSLFLKAKNDTELESVKKFLKFGEVSEINLGYSKHSNKGTGPGAALASSLLDFFLNDAAGKIINGSSFFPDGKFNPDILQLLAKNIGPDHLSDLAAGLMMDYLVEYTQTQCTKHNIPTSTLPINQTFDFKNNAWTHGGYFELPKNPLRKGQPVIFVPKRLLRAKDVNAADKATFKIVGILKTHPDYKNKFGDIIGKATSEITFKDVRAAVLSDGSIIKKYLEAVEAEGIKKYDFIEDPFHFLSFKKFVAFFKDFKPGAIKPGDCDSVLKQTNRLIEIFKTEMEVRDGWKEMWRKNGSKKDIPCSEESMGRFFRGMAHAFFANFPSITFIAEAGTGNGYVDFLVVFDVCRIAIEIKKLSNITRTGNPPLPGYIHGLRRQLPAYTLAMSARYAIYLTGQHTKIRKRRVGIDATTAKIKKLTDLVAEIEPEMKKQNADFISLRYVNIDLTQKPSASKI